MSYIKKERERERTGRLDGGIEQNTKTKYTATISYNTVPPALDDICSPHNM